MRLTLLFGLTLLCVANGDALRLLKFVLSEESKDEPVHVTRMLITKT